MLNNLHFFWLLIDWQHKQEDWFLIQLIILLLMVQLIILVILHRQIRR